MNPVVGGGNVKIKLILLVIFAAGIILTALPLGDVYTGSVTMSGVGLLISLIMGFVIIGKMR